MTGQYNKMLNIMPYNCRYCKGGFKGMVHISDAARAQELFLTEIQKGDANKGPVWDALAAEEPIFVNGFGHGNNSIYTGDSESMIFDTTHCDILSGRVVYLLSCLTANALGPAIIDNGGIAYGGFNISWTWMANNVDADPYTDWYAEGFYRASNEFPIALIQGEPVFRAEERSIAEYDRWIHIWSSERADDPNAAAAIKWLIHDRDGLTVLGNKSAVIVAPGERPLMVVDTEPPSKANAREIFQFDGRLLDKDSNPLTDKTINLWVDGAQANTITTGSDGGWTFGITLEPGIHGLYAQFPGDDEHSPCYTKGYTVRVGITEMSVTVEPPSAVDPGAAFHFAGTLSSEIAGGLLGMTINLYRIGVEGPIATTTTGADGVWGFDVVIDAEGHHRVRAEFPGDADYVRSVMKEYPVAVGVLPCFGCLKGPGNSWTDGGNGRRIKGWVFECPEDGYAKSITAFLRGTGKVKWAIWDFETNKLLAVTEEREFIETVRDWQTFILKESPPVEAKHKYILGIMETGGMVLTWYDGEYSQELWDETPYGDFPDTFKPWIGYSWVSSVYCSYKPGPPPPTWTLSIASDPISVPVSIDGKPIGNTPAEKTVEEGMHTVEAPSEVTVDTTKYRFDRWEDGTTNPSRTVEVKADMGVTAYYKEVEIVGTVTMRGSVSAQSAAGETVTWTVTKPDGTTEEVTCQTGEDLKFSVDYTNVPGNYKTKARIGENDLYGAAESNEVEFTLGKDPRTITIEVVPKTA